MRHFHKKLFATYSLAFEGIGQRIYLTLQVEPGLAPPPILDSVLTNVFFEANMLQHLPKCIFADAIQSPNILVELV